MKQYLDLLQRIGGRISTGHNQETAPEVHHPRITLVPPGRYQRKISARKRRTHLERMGGRER